MNSTERLTHRMSFFRTELGTLEKLQHNFQKNERTANFNRLDRALRGNAGVMTDADKERAKKAAAELGGIIPLLVERNAYSELREIIRAHQKGAGAQLHELNQRRAGLGRASGKLSRVIRKATRPVRNGGEFSAKWVLTAKDREGGGRNKVRPTKQVETKKGRKFGK